MQKNEEKMMMINCSSFLDFLSVSKYCTKEDWGKDAGCKILTETVPDFKSAENDDLKKCYVLRNIIRKKNTFVEMILRIFV